MSWPNRTVQRLFTLAAPLLLLAACGTTPRQPATVIASNPAPVTSSTGPAAPVLPKANSGRGGYYKDDGPGDNIPDGLENVVDPIPVIEPYAKSSTNRPYVVFGKTYTPVIDDNTPFIQRGTATWYGKKFHGQRTSSGEPYDMYKITAAHPVLPIPSYARVTNLENGKQIIVRINDRGPFHSERIIDLSYTAALKLGILAKGSSKIEVERLLPADIEKMAENRKNQPFAASQQTAAASTPAGAPTTQLAGAAQVQTAPVADNPEITIEQLISSSNARPEQLNGQATPATAAGSDGNLRNPAYYLQFGAFAIRANAEAILSHVRSRANHKLPALDIVQQGSLYRLVSGPFVNRSEATSAMNQAQDLGIGKPLVVLR